MAALLPRPLAARRPGTVGHRLSPRLTKASRRIATVRAADKKDVLEVVQVPESREAAVTQAAQCVQAQLPKAGPKQKRKRGFQATISGKRLAVEIPDAGTGAEDTVLLAQDLLKALRPKLGNMTAVFAKEDAAAAAKQRLKGTAAACLGLREACGGSNLLGSLLLVEPESSDVALVQQLLDEVWQGEVVVVLNPAWSPANVPSEFKPVIESFETVFSFLPVSIQGMLGSTQEGAVLRQATSSNLKDCPWLILYQQDNQFVKVVGKPVRPSAQELELVFYNMTAATSPVAKGVGAASSFLRGLIPGGRK